MTPCENLRLNTRCLWRDLRRRKWHKVNFHRRGFARAVKMAIREITERAAAPVAVGSGSVGLANASLSLWHVASACGQAVLLILSIISVLLGIYIAWPKFVKTWRKQGGLRVFTKGPDGDD